MSAALTLDPATKRTRVLDLITANPGRIFHVTTVKRTTGELRTFRAQFNATRHNERPAFRFNPAERGLLLIQDLALGEPRLLNLDGVTRLAIDGGRVLFEESTAVRGPALPYKGARCRRACVCPTTGESAAPPTTGASAPRALAALRAQMADSF